MLKEKTSRRELRVKALQILYAYEMNGEGLSRLIDGILSDVISVSDKEFCTTLVNRVVAYQKELDRKIKMKVSNWEVERIALMDRLLLRIGITEIQYFTDIPPKVSINEVIEIAKEFSTEKSGKFINGVLDSILDDLNKEGKLKKQGRGLLDSSIPKKQD